LQWVVLLLKLLPGHWVWYLYFIFCLVLD